MKRKLVRNIDYNNTFIFSFLIYILVSIPQRYPKQGLGCASIPRIGLQVSLDVNGNI